MKKLLAIISVLVLLTPAIVIAGFDADGWNLESNMYKGSGDVWGQTGNQVTVKWSDDFDLNKLCDGTQNDTQEVGAWYKIIIKRPDNSVTKNWYECGTEVLSHGHSLFGCNCYIAKTK